MSRSSRIIFPVILGAALAVPVSIRAAGTPKAIPAPLDRRYEDREHHDQHEWNDREERAYRHWLEDRHERYVEFARLERARQEEYWRWRHANMSYEGPHRVWDYDRRRWLEWDAREDAAYRRWLAERHYRDIEYERLERARQEEYWRWRRQHGE
jgi:hypothetical protein